MSPRIVTATEVMLEDEERNDPERARLVAEMKAGQEALLRLARATETPFCGMTSRAPAPWIGVNEVRWVSYGPPMPMTARISGAELVDELYAWGQWLSRALGMGRWHGPRFEPQLLAITARDHPPPPGRTFGVQVWPPLARGPEPKRIPGAKGRRRRR